MAFDIILYSEISVLPHNHQRSFFMKKMETEVKTQSKTISIEWENLEYWALNEMSQPSTPSQGTGNPREEDSDGWKKGKEMENTKKTRPLNQHETHGDWDSLGS